MALIIAGSYMVRYPLGGMMSWSLQWLYGLQKLGHTVIFVEKSHYPDSCYDPIKRISSNAYDYGLKATVDLLERFGLSESWCYVDYDGNYHGMTRSQIEAAFRDSDLFLDLGTHGSWLEEATGSTVRVLVDGEPGYTQIRMQNGAASSGTDYDYYFSNGAEVGKAQNTVPTCGKTWRSVFNPVVTDLFTVTAPPDGAAYSTVMNWKSHEPCIWNGQAFGQKDIEFEKFFELSAHTTAAMEIAVSGKNVPSDQLTSLGWKVRDAQSVTISYDNYIDYICSCRGEFSVCKNVFVALETGWFSDRSAAYLASGRPVVLQDTGFSRHLPVGEGLFAVRNVDEAAAAISEIESNYKRHASKAREIANSCLDTNVILRNFFNEIGVQ